MCIFEVVSFWKFSPKEERFYNQNQNTQFLPIKLKITLFIVLLSLAWNLHAQDNKLVKAIYIDNFFSADSTEIILGDSIAEQTLFDYAQNCGFNYFILYGLSAVPLGNNPEAVNALRNFVRQAHEIYDIKIGCVGQSSSFFQRIHEKYQSLAIVDSVERLDSYNLEFEFWKSYQSGIYTGYYCENYLQPNGYSCDSIGAFEFAVDELVKIDSIAAILSDTSLFAHSSEVSTEIYIGWINDYHAQVLVDLMEEEKLDRILGATYKPPLPDGSLELYNFYHQLRRLGFLGASQKQVNYLPLFAVKESEDNHLQDWLDTIGSIPLVWEHYQSEFESDTAAYTHFINLKGYAWYNYSNIPLCFDTLSSSGWLNGPEGELFKDSTYHFELLDTENADRFYWEIPDGVTWADSSHWSAEAKLRFNLPFVAGDSIAVRAANRCHIGERQYFMVQAFNQVKKIDDAISSVFYQDGKLHLQLKQSGNWNYQILNLQGQVLRDGFLNNFEKSYQISFMAVKSFYVLRIFHGEKQESNLFLVP